MNNVMNNAVCKKIRAVFTVMVLGCLGVFCALNIYNFFQISKSMIQNQETVQSKNVFSDIENTFRENVKYRNQLVDAYGMYQRVIDHNVVGNFEYVAADGRIHMINDVNRLSMKNDTGGGYWNTKHFLAEMQKLKDYTEEKDIPLVYVQAPNREIADDNSTVTEFNVDDETMNVSVSALKKMGIPVLDIREKLKTKEHDFPLSDVFFHTDLHMQTDAELWMGAQVADFLEDEYNITFQNKEYLTDMSYYTKNSYEFLGNFGRTNGKYFVGMDTFDIYHPNWPTSYSLYIAGEEEPACTGAYENVVLNGYENMPMDEYTYWITNYMRFTLPGYSYVNHNQKDTKLLFITDSMAYRAMAHLSLTVNEVTVLDPRYFNGGDYVRMALEDDYDAVIVLQENYLMGTTFLQ